MTFKISGTKSVTRSVTATIDSINYSTINNGSTYELTLTTAQENALPNSVVVSVNDGVTTVEKTVTDPASPRTNSGVTTLARSGATITATVTLDTAAPCRVYWRVAGDAAYTARSPSENTSNYRIHNQAFDVGTSVSDRTIQVYAEDHINGTYITPVASIFVPATSGSLSNNVDLSGSLVSMGSWTTAKWREVMGGLETAYTPTNMHHLSLIDASGARWIRQRHQAASNGSDRVIAPFELPSKADTIKVKQTIKVDSNFTWGTRRYSGKLGFGVGSGINTTGGNVNNQGSTFRISWDEGGELACYSYNVYPASDNPPYGQETGTGFYITPGTAFTVEFEVRMNSTFSANDGWYKVWVNDQLRVNVTGVGWYRTGYQGETKPKVNRITWSEFHGGSNGDWSPTSTTYAQTKDISWETS